MPDTLAPKSRTTAAIGAQVLVLLFYSTAYNLLLRSAWTPKQDRESALDLIIDIDFFGASVALPPLIEDSARRFSCAQGSECAGALTETERRTSEP